MEWKGAATDAETAVAAGVFASFYVVLPSEARAMTSPTLIRSLGTLNFFKPVSSSVRGAWGLITWDDIDDSPPVGGDNPAPYTRPDLNWIWHEYLFSPAIAGAGAAGSASSLGPGTLVQSKAMRKLPDPRGVLFVVQNAVSSTASFSFMAGWRCLLKE